MSAISAVNIGKAYRIYRRPVDSLKELILRRDYAETFWALRGVSLKVAQGGSLGIVGDNGAGKTTLLKLLSGSTTPSEGTLERSGRLSAILSLGAGFHPDLSGAENIRIGCAVMGLSPEETDEVLPRIVEFSELASFIDRPVKTYSSGMYLRLGFSVATVSGPNVLIVDEHLSVGDQHFRHKCMRRIMALLEDGCSLVFCSHDLHSLGEVCQQTLWIRDGKPRMLGPTSDVLKEYQDHVRARDGQEQKSERPVAAQPASSVAGENAIESVALKGDCVDGVVETGSALELEVMVRVSDAAREDGVHLGVLLVRNDSAWCYGVTTQGDGIDSAFHPAGDGRFGTRFIIPRLMLLSGEYSFTIALMDSRSPHVYDSKVGCAPITVRHNTKEVGMVRLEHRWAPPDPAPSVYPSDSH